MCGIQRAYLFCVCKKRDDGMGLDRVAPYNCSCDHLTFFRQSSLDGCRRSGNIAFSRS